MIRPDSQEAMDFEEEVEVVAKGDMDDYLSDIQFEVSRALRLIEDISGIEQIEECANILRNLETELE